MFLLAIMAFRKALALGLEHPYVILTRYNNVRRWLGKARLRVPRDIGLTQLGWRSSLPDWAGMNQPNDVVGEAAVADGHRHDTQ